LYYNKVVGQTNSVNENAFDSLIALKPPSILIK